MVIHGKYHNSAGHGLARTKGLIAISPCRSLHAKLVFLAIWRLRLHLFVQGPEHTVLLSTYTVVFHRFSGSRGAIRTIDTSPRRHCALIPLQHPNFISDGNLIYTWEREP